MANAPRKPGSPGTPSLLDVPVTNPHDIAAVYSNHFGVSATMTDLTICFLEVGQIPGLKGPIPKQEIKAIVTLPMLAAAGMIQVLQQVLQTHTEQLAKMQKDQLAAEVQKKISSGQ